jgi:hypothetical protein
MSWKKIAWLVIIVLLAAFVLAYASPAFLKTSDIDSAIFQYAGNGIRSGQLPYRDIYDHKPPAIFYINALGLALGGGSRWGIWIIELLSLSTAGAFCALYLKRFFGAVPAMLATAAFLLNISFFHEGGNLTEEYALPFEFGALFFLGLWAAGKRPRLMAILIGFSIACASTFKQPLGALAVSFFVFLFMSTYKKQGRRHFFATLAWVAFGFITVWLGWFAFFAFHGALAQFWEAAFSYNFALSSISPFQRFLAIKLALQTLFTIAPYYLFALLAWMVLIAFLLLNSHKLHSFLSGRWPGWLLIGLGLVLAHDGIFLRGFTLYPAEYFGPYHMGTFIFGIIILIFGICWLTTPLPNLILPLFHKPDTIEHSPLFLPLFVAALDLPIQLLMISLSGNNFGHYYMSILPSMTVLCAYFFWSQYSHPDRRQAVVWTAVLAIPVFWYGCNSIMQKTTINENGTAKDIAAYVQEVTQPGDPVFFWGNLVPLYIESQRLSPSIFYFTDPLFLKGYTNRQHTGPFLEQLQASPPKILIVLPNMHHPFIYTEDPAQCSQLADMEHALQLAYTQYKTDKIFIPDGMPEVYAWICANYTLNEISFSGINDQNHIVYQYTPNR